MISTNVRISKLTIDQALLKKYNINGPRYTSYPTAKEFSESVSSESYHWHVEDSNQDPIPKPLSLYLHIPFCKSLCYYCGCHKVITQNTSKAQNYLDTLHKEIELQAKLFAKDREVKQIHLGGGTPTYFNTADIHKILDTIENHFNLTPISQREFGIEIDPRTTTTTDIKRLALMGFNRMSFGIQDFDRDVQIAINRIQDKDETIDLLKAARSAGTKSLSVDLIYGLPKQTADSFAKTLEEIIKVKPDRIALYNYAHMPQTIKSQKLINDEDIPSAKVKLALLTLSIDTLTAVGYRHIGMDHFALPDDPLSQSLEQGTLHRNFQGYSTHGDCDIIGFGVSAISKVGDIFSQNYKKLFDYQNRIQQKSLAIEKGCSLSIDDKIRAAVIQHIMCSQTLDINAFNRTHSIIFECYFKKEIEKLSPMINDGLLIITPEKLKITEKGRLLLRNIAMAFDTYLSEKLSKDENLIKFSKVL